MQPGFFFQHGLKTDIIAANIQQPRVHMEFKFIPFDETQRPAWDAFVASNPHSWVGHDSAHIDFEESLGHPSFSHLVLDERGKVAGVTPLFFQASTRGRIRFKTLMTGTGLRGAPLIAADMPPKTRREFWRAWADWIRNEAPKQKVDEIRVSFPHFIGTQHISEFYEVNPLRELGFHDTPNLTMLKDLSAVNGDVIASFEKKCRSALKKAAEAGAEWVAISDRGQWLAFDELNKQTFAEESADAYSRRTLEIVWDRFVARGLARVAALRCDGRWISAGVRAGNQFSEYNWILFNERPRTIQGGTNFFIGRDIENMRARGIHWCELGSLEFDDPRQRNIAEFKRSFGGRVCPSMDCKLVLNPLKAATAAWLQALAGRLRDSKKAGSIKTDNNP